MKNAPQSHLAILVTKMMRNWAFFKNPAHNEIFCRRCKESAEVKQSKMRLKGRVKYHVGKVFKMNVSKNSAAR